MVEQKVEKLIAVLDEMGSLLRDLDHAHWAGWMNESARRLRNGDLSGVDHLLRAYGGMGSFNDILWGSGDGATVESEHRAASLRSEAWLLAKEIRRELATE